MDLVDLVRIGLRRWYIAVPASLIVLVASLAVYSSVDLEYKSTGSLLLFAPREAVVAQNPLLGFNSLNVPASVTAQVVSSLETRERLASLGASPDYEVGVDPANPAPLVIAVATGGLEQARRTVELVLAEVASDLERRQKALGAPPGTWITAEIVTPPTRPVAQSGARTRAFIAVFMVGMVLSAGLTLLVDVVGDRRSGAPRRRRRARDASDAWEPDAVPAPVPPPFPSVPAAAPPATWGPVEPRREMTASAPVPPAPPVPAPGPAAPTPAPRSTPAPQRDPGRPVPAPASSGPDTAAPAPPAAVAPAPSAPAPQPAPVPPPPAPPPPATGSPASPPEGHESGDGAARVWRRHPYLVAREGDVPPADDGETAVRKSGTD